MSISKANALLQELYRGLTDRWKGTPTNIKCSWDAYELCREIIKEADEKEGEKKDEV